MLGANSIAASARITGRFLLPMTRTYASSNGSRSGVTPRSFSTSQRLRQCGGKSDCPKPSKCVNKCVVVKEACKHKRPPCPRRPCLPPCHACPQEDPCWHCPYTPPPCPKRKPCCPIQPTTNPYAYKSVCSPPVDECRKKCVPCEPPPPPPRKLTRCELPGAADDPCCSRSPKCPDPCNPKPEDTCDNDCPEKPKAPDPCRLEGEICNEDECEFKKPEVCCSKTPERDIKCCPRRQKKHKKKRVIKRTCCLNLDPNWPPKRPECSCDFPYKELGPCQQAVPPKKDFWDGLC